MGAALRQQAFHLGGVRQQIAKAKGDGGISVVAPFYDAAVGLQGLAVRIQVGAVAEGDRGVQGSAADGHHGTPAHSGEE